MQQSFPPVSETPVPPPAAEIERQVRNALDEDLGDGDLTAALIPAQANSSVRIVSREPGVLCGSAWVEEVFRQLDPGIEVTWEHADGARLRSDTLLCRLRGGTRALLSGERTALNFLQTLSGTATQAWRYVRAVEGTGVRLLDTRKTLPGLRLAQKYAVRCGGCHNHRIGLYDAILIKENHIRAAGSITAALKQAQCRSPQVEIEVEVESVAELREALAADAKRVLLDNFSPRMLREAVAENAGRARLEASGGVDLDSIRGIAMTGVDDISIGGITKDLKALDLSMLFEDEA